MHHVNLVGILNITPDSFSKDGIHDNVRAATLQAQKLFTSGAHLVDIGAEATNPWASPVAPLAEWQRLEPVLSKLLLMYPNKISVDTHHPETVRRIVQKFGKTFIVNDVTGMNNLEMQEVVAQNNLTCIISHLPAQFETDIKSAHGNATMDEPAEVLAELVKRRAQLIKAGLRSEKIILDPGIGFGKTAGLNVALLKFAALVHKANLPNKVMIGYSRKRFLGEHRFETEPNLNAAKVAIAAGADYLRVHDVIAHRELLDATS